MQFSAVFFLFHFPTLSCYKPSFESWVGFKVCLPYMAHSTPVAEITSQLATIYETH